MAGGWGGLSEQNVVRRLCKRGIDASTFTGINYLCGFGVPLRDPLLDQFDQGGDVVKLRLLQDSWNGGKTQRSAILHL